MPTSNCNPTAYLERAVIRRGGRVDGVSLTEREDGDFDLHVEYPPSVSTVTGPVAIRDGRTLYYGSSEVFLCIEYDEEEQENNVEWRRLTV